MNTQTRRLLISAACTLLVCAGPRPRAAPAVMQPGGDGEVAILLVNGRIHTPGGVAEAMAIDAQGLIVGIGTSEELDRLRHKAARRIDLHGHAVLPGFHDLHVHPICRPTSATLRDSARVIACSTATDRRRLRRQGRPGQVDYRRAVGRRRRRTVTESPNAGCSRSSQSSAPR